MLSLLVLSMAVAFFAAGFAPGHFGIPGEGYTASTTPLEHARQFRIFWEAWHKIEQRFYSPTPLDTQAMTYGAIRGVGLEPDIVVAPTGPTEAEDASLRRAVDYLEQKTGHISTGRIAPLRSRDSGKVMV